MCMKSKIAEESHVAAVERPYRQIAAAVVGNLIEWYDWYIYSLLAVYFAEQYFPSDSEGSLVPLLAALGVFAVGFFMRPLGSLFLGRLGDRYGRKKALQTTVSLMGVGSLLIGLSPTYEQIGLLAPVILIAARLLQGLSTGGEYGSASAFLVESAPPNRRGFFSSFFYLGATAGNVAAVGSVALLSGILDQASMESWGWRVPFLIGAAASLCAIWIRRSSVETLAMSEAPSGSAPKSGMFDFVRQHPRQTLQVVGMQLGPSVAFYTWVVFLPTYAQITVGFDRAESIRIGLISLIFFWAVVPVCGWASDKVGRKPFLYASSLAFTVGTVPLLGMLSNSFWSLLVVQCAGMAALACFASIASAVQAELFPSRIRVLGIGFPYALTVAIFGGTGPYIATWLIDSGRTSLFSWYIAALSAITFLTFVSMPETARKPLED
ncbi:MFS transporter [Rhodococcus sp. ABRD24]|nr:MFS transporter [Rhodococcus sp. ABRD24]